MPLASTEHLKSIKRKWNRNKATCSQVQSHIFVILFNSIRVKLSDEFKVGVFASVAIVLLILGFNFLKGNDLLSNSDTMMARYRKIDGLGKANPVFFYGLQIGKVVDISTEYDELDSLVITVTFTVNPDVRIPVNSTAKIISSDILQSKAIEIFPNKKETAFAQNGDFLVGKTDLSLTDQMSAVITPLKTQTQKLMKDLASTIEKIEKTLDEDSQDNIKASLTNFKESSKQLSNLLTTSSKDIVVILDDFKGASSSVKTTSSELEGTIKNINELTTELKQAPIASTLEEAKAAMIKLNEVLTAANSTDGTLGLLINDPKLYEDLDAAIRSVEALSNDLQAHPRNYFSPLGKKNPKKGKTP